MEFSSQVIRQASAVGALSHAYRDMLCLEPIVHGSALVTSSTDCYKT